MAAEIHRLRDRAGETEKITINLGYVDLGHIDLLVQEGFYSNRTDFIRTAIRTRIAAHGEEVKKSIVRHTLELGLRHFTRADLEAARAAGEKLHIRCSASPVLPLMYHRNWPWRRSNRSPCWVPCTRPRRSRMRWPIAFPDARILISFKGTKT